MALASEIITSARYDLKDEDSTQYSDTMLTNFLNRGLRNLVAVLGSVKSDWVKASTDLTLSSGNSTVNLPSDFSIHNQMWIDTTEITKTDWEVVKHILRTTSSTGQPYKYALQGTEIQFDSTADQDYTIEFLYYKGIATLTTASTMPFNSEFDDSLLESIVLIAKNKDEYDVSGDAALYDFFMQYAMRKVTSRNHKPKRWDLGF
jgi:hypothetical protein